MKLLMHVCCGPCACYPISVLKEKSIDFEGLYFNPNIQPFEEFVKRRDNVEILSRQQQFNVTYFNDFAQYVWESFPGTTDERCNMCYTIRLEKTALFAKENGFDSFTTSLLVSPYQDHELICKIANKAAEKHGLDFYYEDFRTGYRQGQQMAKDAGLYRQKYCGCIRSLHGDGK